MNGFSYTGIEIINSEDIVIKKKRKVKKEVDYNYLLKNTIIATSSVVLDRKYVNDISMPLLRSGQDYATWLSILRNGIIAIGIDKPLVKYRQTNNSLSKNKFKSVKQVWFIQKKYEKIGFFKRIINTILFVFNATVKKIF
jgi:teichuronic acid biosynthesis glycosyltransferase TuaG